MTRKLYLLLVGAVVSGALVAACGTSSSTTPTVTSSASTTSSAAPSSSASTSSSATTSSSARTSASSSAPSSTSSSATTSTSRATSNTSTGSGTPATLPTLPSGASIVAACRSLVAQHAAVLTGDEQAQLKQLCKAEGSGDVAQINAAKKQICLTVIKDSGAGLSGAALTAAEQSCSKVGLTPAG